MAQLNAKDIDAKTAVKLAVAYVADMYKDDGISDVLLEEIEMNDLETIWRVTVSFLRPHLPDGVALTGITAAILGSAGARTRAYKVIEVDRATGQIRSMKIREMPRSSNA